MLAHAVGERFGSTATLLSRTDLDISDVDSVDEAVRGFETVINAAAYTAVDDAESHEADAFLVNATGAGNVARACERHGARLIHVSTDYVFDGTARTPYAEDSPTAPLSAYGRTKLAGEHAVRALHPAGTTVVRTAWLYGAGGRSFVATMLERARSHQPVSVVTDQIGQPTWTGDVAQRIDYLLDAQPGTFHATNSGQCSWWDLAVAIYESVGSDTALVTRTTSDAFPRPAPRPSFSVLADDAAVAAGVPPMRHWRKALDDALRLDFGV